MKRCILFLVSFLVVLVFATCASAGVLSVNCYNDGDGAITMNNWWNSDLTGHPADIDVYLDETLHWGPAHALADIGVDGDPTVRFTKDVDNDTISAWDGYVINVVRNGPFSITSASMLGPTDWNTPVVTAPTLQLSGIYAGEYLGTVSYSVGTGTDIPITGSGEFKFTTSFTGSSTFTLEQTPYFNGAAIVPEPGTFALLVLGSLSAVAIFKRRRQAL